MPETTLRRRIKKWFYRFILRKDIVFIDDYAAGSLIGNMVIYGERHED
jgi:hypothetical protein